ncbi:hypothetical protein GCM10009547_21780 [Sporichthya brevicatena]|uniref:Uncharacterized protein n=1 Tax=Sporichthya brevicatena TaxID=171442 RepID=A0ABN1GTH5_9ACTN
MIGTSWRPLPKAWFRAAVLGVVLASSTLAASPAMALTRDDGDDPGEGISNLKVIGIFVGIPVGLLALIWLVVSIPYMIRGPRYRPGKEWTAEAEWYGAPGEDGPAALESGSADPALEGAPADAGTDAAGGGTSARW